MHDIASMDPPAEESSTTRVGNGAINNQDLAGTRRVQYPAEVPYRSQGHDPNKTATPHYHDDRLNGNNGDLDPRKNSTTLDRERKSTDQQRMLTTKDKSTSNGNRRPSGSNRVCGKCGGGLTGQFVRALEDTFHLECFTCHVGIQRHLQKICG